MPDGPGGNPGADGVDFGARAGSFPLGSFSELFFEDGAVRIDHPDRMLTGF